MAGAQEVPPPPADAPAAGQLEGTPAEEQETSKDAKPKKPKRVLDLGSPQATMREFLLANQDAAGDHPERIEDAVACLDISELEGDDRSERAGQLARRLHAVIDRLGVKLDDLPDKTEETDYRFYPPPSVTDTESLPQIRLASNVETGIWQFTAFTVASIPDLEKVAEEEAEPSEPAESKVPAARRTPRATMTTFLEAMQPDVRKLEEAIKCLDPAGQDPDAWSVRGKDLAVKLKNVMDKIKLAVLTEIPDTPDGPAYAWYTSETGNIVIGRITEGTDPKGNDLKGEWRFTPETLNTLDALYLAFEDQPIVSQLAQAGIEEELTFGLWIQRRMPQWCREKFLYLQGWQWLALAALLVAGWLIKIVAPAIATLMFGAWLRKRRIGIDREVYKRALRSTGVLAAALFWLCAIEYLQLQLPVRLTGALLWVLPWALALIGVWVGYRLVDILGGYIASNREVKLTRFDDVLIPLLRKILRLAVVLVVVLIVLAWLKQPPASVLGALGIGGVALAFAAKDTLGNFFGSLTVLFDRPFGIGDWICIGDVDGTVEHVGFRSTRIRTFYNSVITIPNAKMVDTLVDNYGARRYRRAKVMLSITYDTPPEKIDAFCEGIRELIRLHPYTRKDYYHVYFNNFAASSLDILLYTFFEVPDWSTELRERHRLFIDILRLAKRLGVQFAFPTQTLWLERARGATPAPEDVEITPGREDPDAVGLSEAVRAFEESYGPTPAVRGPVVIDASPRSKRKKEATQGDDGE
jgi:MscS family membrane protein